MIVINILAEAKRRDAGGAAGDGAVYGRDDEPPGCGDTEAG
jgi:hypothetical protein